MASEVLSTMNSVSVTALIDAIPDACALFEGERLLDCNVRFREGFKPSSTLSMQQLLVALALEVWPDPDTSRTTRHAASNRWYSVQKQRVDEDRRWQLIVLHDITEQRHLERQQRQQQESLSTSSQFLTVGEMTTTLAHELNQPLAATINYLNVALSIMSNESAAAFVEPVKEARDQAMRAANIIKGIRQFVAAREPQRSIVTVEQLVVAALTALKLPAEHARVVVTTAFEELVPEINVDRVMVEQVLVNLIKNAFDAVEQNPVGERLVKIQTRLNLDNQVQVEVIDNGSGVAESIKSKLFSPFATTKSNGMGVGLPLCRSIIEYHQGRLFYRALAERGSLFGFAIPSAADSQRGRAP